MYHHTILKRHALIAQALLVGFFLALAIALLRAPATYLYDGLMYALAPSAERAMTSGNRYFDAQNPHLYNILHAMEFYNRAFALDPRYPFLQHQLARVAFLKGDLAEALARINLELKHNPDPDPSSLYVRGLIAGYMGRYQDSIADYERYLEFDPSNWAAVNDLAWVLLKADRPKDAAVATREALALWPENPWLLNTQAIALYEMNAFERAYESIQKAQKNSAYITERDWLVAYPGNDPRIARDGIAVLRKSIRDNMHRIELAVGEAKVQ